MAKPRVIRKGTTMTRPDGFWTRATVLEIKLFEDVAGLRPILVLDAWCPVLEVNRTLDLSVESMQNLERMGALQVFP